MNPSHKKDFDALASAYIDIFEKNSDFTPCSHCNTESKCSEAGKCLAEDSSVQEKVAKVESGTETAINSSIEAQQAEEEAKQTGDKLPQSVQRLKQTADRTIAQKTKSLQASNNAAKK